MPLRIRFYNVVWEQGHDLPDILFMDVERDDLEEWKRDEDTLRNLLEDQFDADVLSFSWDVA